MIWAFEETLRVARGGTDLLPHFLAATACLLARAEEATPRGVLEASSVGRRPTRFGAHYLPLFEQGRRTGRHSVARCSCLWDSYRSRQPAPPSP
jgi:hypothetical protein